MERHLEHDLEELKQRLLWMGSLAERAVHQAIHAVLDGQEPLAQTVLREESAINDLQIEIDDRVVQLLALHQLMAADLRFVLAVARINNDLERIGDQAAGIAQRAQLLKGLPRITLPPEIETMGEKTGIMIRTAIQSLLEGDARMADFVLSLDDEVDDMNRAVQADLMDLLQREPGSSLQALNAILISRNLERAGDHATNIAETVYYMIEGRPITDQRPKGDTTSFGAALLQK